MCNADWDLEGTVDEIPFSGVFHVVAEIPVASTVNGYELKVNLSSPASCSVEW